MFSKYEVMLGQGATEMEGMDVTKLKLGSFVHNLMAGRIGGVRGFGWFVVRCNMLSHQINRCGHSFALMSMLSWEQLIYLIECFMNR